MSALERACDSTCVNSGWSSSDTAVWHRLVTLTVAEPQLAPGKVRLIASDMMGIYFPI